MSMPRRTALAALNTDRHGVALIEFALILPLMLSLLAILIDLGFCYNARLSTLRGVAAGAMYAHQNGGGVTPATATELRATITAIVLDGAGSAKPTVTVLINGDAGSSSTNSYHCSAGYPTRWTTTGTASAVCPDGTMSAKFVTISTSGTSAASIPFASFGRALFPLDETIVVRTR